MNGWWRRNAGRMILHLALATAAVWGCGCGRRASDQADAAGKIVLTVWDWHAADPSKGIGLWLTQIDREFERRHPNIKIKHVGQSHTEYYQIFKAAAAAKRGPDVVMLHEGSRVLDQRDSLMPLTKYVTPEFRAKIVGWDLTCEGFDPNGTPWAVPIAVQGLVWYYNRALLKKSGFDPDKPPQTWAEFVKVCEALTQAGKAGVAVGEKEGYWAEWFVNSAYFQTLAPGDIERLSSGRMTWTDPKIARILDKLKELDDRGCFQRGFISTPLFPDAGEAFMRGDAAFFLGLISDVAHWKDFGEMLGSENLGVMTCPVFQPGPRATMFPAGGGFAYAVTSWSKHPDEAFEYIAFIANEENAKTFLSQVGSFPANQNYDRNLISDPTARVIAGWLSSGRAGTQMLGTMPTSVNEALRRECQRLLSGQTDVAKALAAVEKIAAAARTRRPATPATKATPK